MAKKAPRRTAERILEVTLALFNRFGEPNVSTTLIAAELRISPGNLYYHYPAKDELINSLYERYQKALLPLLSAAPEVRDVEDAWFFMHSLFERVWEYRFLYRDLGDLLTRNRRLETDIQAVLELKRQAFRAVLDHLEHTSALSISPEEGDLCATQMVVMLTWWLSYEYARDPRHALEDAQAQNALLRGARHVLGLILPYLQAEPREHLRLLLLAYQDPASAAPAGGQPA
jgi:AcrR family transcriptional regulator